VVAAVLAVAWLNAHVVGRAWQDVEDADVELRGTRRALAGLISVAALIMIVVVGDGLFTAIALTSILVLAGWIWATERG